MSNYKAFLRSEWWKNFRLGILAGRKAKCNICKLQSSSNDIHHIFYPRYFCQTRAHHVVILCRDCHEKVHKLFHPKEIKTLGDARALYFFAKEKIKATIKVTPLQPRKLRDSAACYCCGKERGIAYYNLFKFDPKFKVARQHFIFMCETCGNFLWEHINTSKCLKAREVYRQYDDLKPVARNRLTTLLVWSRSSLIAGSKPREPCLRRGQPNP